MKRLLILTVLAMTVLAVRAAEPVAFTRYIDRTEGAFLLLVPSGWQTAGGIVRVNPLAAGGSGNATEAKIDFAVMREPEGRVAIRWLPKINYAQPSPYNAMLNGNWNGMPVVAMPSAADYLTRLLFPSLHPKAGDVRIEKTQPRPDSVAALRQLPVARAVLSQGARYVADATMLTVTYTEGGVRYRELLFVALEGYELMGTGLWSNPFTIVARAPVDEYEAYGRVAKVVVNSFALNPLWFQGEAAGQIHRGGVAADTLRRLAEVDAQIARNRAETMAQINRQEYLTLTDQECYRNPFTGEKEYGSNQWKHRWTNAGGEQFYSDDDHWDPNRDPKLHVSGYQRSPSVEP